MNVENKTFIKKDKIEIDNKSQIENELLIQPLKY